MTALVLRWRRPDPAVVVRWAGSGDAVTACADTVPPTPLAAIIGPPGPAAGLSMRIAGEALGGHRAVEIRTDGMAWLADPASSHDVFGVTAGAAGAGAPATIRSLGEMTEPSWNWSPGAVWLGETGTLTQAVPLSGAAILIGTAAGATALIVNPRLVAQL